MDVGPDAPQRRAGVPRPRPGRIEMPVRELGAELGDGAGEHPAGTCSAGPRQIAARPTRIARERYGASSSYSARARCSSPRSDGRLREAHDRCEPVEVVGHRGERVRRELIELGSEPRRFAGLGEQQRPVAAQGARHRLDGDRVRRATQVLAGGLPPRVEVLDPGEQLGDLVPGSAPDIERLGAQLARLARASRRSARASPTTSDPTTGSRGVAAGRRARRGARAPRVPPPRSPDSTRSMKRQLRPWSSRSRVTGARAERDHLLGERRAARRDAPRSTARRAGS